jgi:hypothetical protein
MIGGNNTVLDKKPLANTQAVTVVPRLDGKNLPMPTEGQLIPGSNLWWLATTPDYRFRYDWKSFYKDGNLTVDDPQLRSKIFQLNERIGSMFPSLPSRNGSDIMAGIFNSISFVFPPMIIWIIMGMCGLIFCKNDRTRTLSYICGLAVTILVITCIGQAPVVFQYRLPFDPLFILFGFVGFKTIGDKWFSRSRRAENKVKTVNI